MRLLLRWMGRAKDRDTRSDGSILFAIANAYESVRFGAADDEALALKCNAIVRKGLDKHAISYAEYRTWRERNDLIFTSVVDAGGSLIGFFDVFPLVAESAEAMLKGTLNERSLALEHIVPRYATADVVYIHIATIMVDPRQTSFTPTVAREALLMQFKKFLEENYEPLERKVFTAYAQTEAGEALLRRAGFSAAVLPKYSGQDASLYVLRPGKNQEAFVRFASAKHCITKRQSQGERVALLDKRIDGIERSVRSLIGTALENRFDMVPANVAQKVQDRIAAAKRRDPLLDHARLAELAEWLEFADLRELQDVVLNKLLWPRFETAFQSKSITELRFGQMAELRNCLRHSRHINLVVEKEGEAAVIWFEEMRKRA